MNKNVEEKETITVEEYQAWITGLYRGIGSAEPSKESLDLIAEMASKIAPDVQYPSIPWTIPTPTYEQPDETPWWENQPMCGTVGQDGGNITIGDNTTIGFTDVNGIAPSSIAIGDFASGCGDYGASPIGTYAPYPVQTYGGKTPEVNNAVVEQYCAEDILAKIRERSVKNEVSIDNTPSTKDRLVAIKKKLMKGNK